MNRNGVNRCQRRIDCYPEMDNGNYSLYEYTLNVLFVAEI